MTQPAPARLHWRSRADLWFGALFLALTAFGLGMTPGGSNQTQAQAQEDVRFFRIAAGPIGGGVFALAGVLAGVFSNPPGGLPCDKGGSCGIPGMIAVVQGVDGSLSALEALQNGQADIAIAALDIALVKAAEKGAAEKGADGATPLRQFRTLATLFTRDLHILVRDESDYRTPRDLRSKRILLAGDAGRLAPLARAVVGAAMPPVHAEASDALAKLAEGEAEAVLMLVPAGNALLVETAKTLPLRLLAVDAAVLPAALANLYRPTNLAGGLYAGIAPTATVGLPVQLLASDTMPVELAQRLTGVLWHNATAKSLTDGPPEGRAMRLDQALMGVSVPLHPGAAAYYHEIGKPAGATPAE